MASFTPEQKAFIKEIVFEATPIILERHMEACVWGKKLNRFIWVGIGLCLAMTLMGFPSLPKLYQWMVSQ